MAKPVLGKSLCSEWLFLGQDFAVRTVSMNTVQPVYLFLEESRQIQNSQPKQCHIINNLLTSGYYIVHMKLGMFYKGFLLT